MKAWILSVCLVSLAVGVSLRSEQSEAVPAVLAVTGPARSARDKDLSPTPIAHEPVLVALQNDSSDAAPAAAVDESEWPGNGTITVRITFGTTDKSPTDWTGHVRASAARVVRIRPWRFEDKMSVDSDAGTWNCGSWYGPDPILNNFAVHRAEPPLPFVIPAVLIDLQSDSPRTAKLDVSTAQGDFTIDLAALYTAGHQTFLAGRVAAEPALFGQPIAAGVQLKQGRDNGVWNDFPSVSVSPLDPNDVWVCYQSYVMSESGDHIAVRRRVNGQWTGPEIVSHKGIDIYRTALCHDGRGTLWVVVAGQVKGQWHLYGRAFADGQWGDIETLTDAPQPDFHHRMVRSVNGALWLVWQGFRNGKSDILARRWNGASWEPELIVSDSPANDWEPAVAPHPDGGIAVAWDSYDSGNYDVFCRHVGTDRTARQMGPVIRVTGSPQLEARASVACDATGRMWVAYDVAGPQWGKDTGFRLELADAPEGTALYRGRGIGLAVVDANDGTVYDVPNATADLALNPTLHEQAEYPHLLSDDDGRLWMFFRKYSTTSVTRRGVGRQFQWDLFVSEFDPDNKKWSPARQVVDSVGRLDMRPGLCSAGNRLWATWATDHRPFATEKRPDVCSVFAGSIDLASLPAADISTVRGLTPRKFPPTEKDWIHPNEKADVARVRSHVIQSGNTNYGIFRGDMHRHTENSPDGGRDGSLMDAYRYAIDSASMDFLLVTDHNDGTREYDWWLREKSNDLLHVGEAFVGLYGYERSVRYPNGHRNVFFTQRGVRPLPILPAENARGEGLLNTGDVLYPYLRINKGICFEHTSATGMGTDWRDNDPQLEPLVEIFQGDRNNYERSDAPWAADADVVATQEGGYQPKGYVDNALTKGYKLGFQASSDHLSTHLSYSCIIAEGNTREALMDAMRKRHAYAATDNILMDVRSEGVDGPKIMGDVFQSKGRPELRVRVVGTVPLRRVIIVKDNEIVFTTNPDGPKAEFTFVDMEAKPDTESFYYVRAEQENERLAWASPLWITYTGP